MKKSAELPWALYFRESQDRTGERHAVSRQMNNIVGLRGRRRELDGPSETYDDNDTSATNRRKPRPDFERLLKDLAAGERRGILVEHPDRLLRSTRDADRLIDVTEVVIYTYSAGDFDLSTANGKRNLRHVAADAQHEVEHKDERQSGARRDAVATRGVRLGGSRGFGYGRTVDGRSVDINKVNKREARALDDAFDRIINGESTTSIWKSWNKRKMLTPKGNAWDGTTFRNSVMRPALVGIVTYQGDVLDVQSDWPAIIDREKWEKVQAILKSPSRRTSPGPKLKYLSGGITYCGAPNCGKPTRSAVNSTGKKGQPGYHTFHVYTCSTGLSGHVSIKAELLDNAVRLGIAEAYLDPSKTRRAEDVEAVTLDQLHDERDAALATQRTLWDALERGIRKPADFDRRQLRLQDEIDAIDTKIATLRSESAHAAMLAEVRELLIGDIEAANSEFRAAEWEGHEFETDLKAGIEWGHKVATFLERFDGFPLEQRRTLVRSLLRVTVNLGRGRDRVVIAPVA